MKKKKGELPEFKRHFYLNWFVQDWLGDQNLKLCPPEVKGFWMDLLMQMVLSFPFGHLSRLSKPLMKESKIPLVRQILVGTLVHQNPEQGSRNLVDQDPGQEDDQWVRLSVGLSLPEQLSLVVNLEPKVPELTGYPAEKVAEWLEILDDLNVFSRTPSGIIYNRRMVRDFTRRKIAFINACRGENIYEYKSKRSKGSSGLPYQKSNQTPDQGNGQSTEQSADQPLGQTSEHPPHQILSNSNSNSNSNYSDSNNSIVHTVGNGSSLGKEVKEKKEEEKDGRTGDSGSGNGNGLSKVDFAGLKKFKEDLLKDKMFMEAFLINPPSKFVNANTMQQWLDFFNLHCVTDEKLEKDYREYKKHFKNWIWVTDTSKAPPTTAEVQGVYKNKEASKGLLTKYTTLT